MRSTLREVSIIRESMSQQNRLLSTIALVTMLRYVMCDLAQTVEIAEAVARTRHRDEPGAAPEEDEDLMKRSSCRPSLLLQSRTPLTNDGPAAGVDGHVQGDADVLCSSTENGTSTSNSVVVAVGGFACGDSG